MPDAVTIPAKRRITANAVEGRSWHDLAWIAVAILTGAVIAGCPPRTAITLVVAAAVVVTTMLKPAVGLAVLVATVPVQDAWPAALGDVTFTWTRLVLASFLLGWGLTLAAGRNRVRIAPIAWAMAAYCLALVASVAHARDLAAWAEETYRWGVALVVFVAATSVVKARSDAWLVAGALGAGITGSLVVAVYQVWTGTGPESFAQRGLLRAYGAFGEPNPFAGYLELATLPLLAIGLAMLGRNEPGRGRWVAYVTLAAAGAGIVALALTQSRGGALGFAAGIAIVAWHSFPRAGRVLIMAGLAVSLIALSLPQARPVRAAFGIDVLVRSGPVQVTSDNFAAQERMAHWGAAVRMWESEPWLGVGAGNFPDRYREFTPTWRFRIARGHAHNGYLQAAAQAGTVGLICYLALLATAWRWCRRRLTEAVHPERRGICVGALAVTGALAVHGMFEYLHVLSLGIVLSAVWALTERERASQVDELVKHVGG